MKLSSKAVLSLALVAGFVLVGGDAFAAVGDAGGSVLTAIEGAVTGNIGLVIGLVLAILGLWTWIVKQETAAGIVMIIGGVLITVAPGIFDTARDIIGPIIGTADADNDALTVDRQKLQK